MQASSIPAKFPIPFAANAGAGYIRSIPEASQIGINNGAASLHDGFPPLCFIPIASGGTPPDGEDMNGILNEITSWDQWAQAGGPVVYDSGFCTAIDGYPNGAILAMADGTGFWRSTVDDNTSNPDEGGANWIATTAYGVVSIALSGTNVTLTAPQWCKFLIVLSGTLSANVQLIFPTGFSGHWLITNNCTGNFVVTAKTASGTGIAIPQGGSTGVWGDGANIYPSSFSVTAAEPANTVYAGPASGAPAQPSFRALTLADLPPLPAGASGAIGFMANAFMSIPSPSASGAFTADELLVETALGGTPTKLASYSRTVNLAGTGAGGMDTGSAPVNGFVSLYAIYGTAGTSILACNVTTSSGSIYSGSHLPNGYSQSALISVWPTGPTGQFVPGVQIGREVFLQPVLIFTGQPQQLTLTAQSVSAAVPPNAKMVSGNMGCNTTAGGAVNFGVAADANGTARQLGGADFVVNLEPQVNGYNAVWTFRHLPLKTAQTIYWFGGRNNDNALEVTSYTF